MANKAIELLKKLFIPSVATCTLCQRSYTTGLQRARFLPMLCPSCNEQLHYVQAPLCTICGRMLDAGSDAQCGDCRQRKQTYFVYNRSAVRYTPIVRDWLYTYKYHSREHLVEGLVALLVQVYKAHYRHVPIEAITFIPLHPERLHVRRFNQAEQLALGLGKYSGLPVLPTLIRTRDTEKQSHQSRKERMEGIQGAFAYRKEAPAGKALLIVDDIYTTGSTLNEAAKIVKEHGWEHVYTCTVARA